MIARKRPDHVRVPSLSLDEWFMAIEETFGLLVFDKEAEASHFHCIGDAKRFVASRVNLAPAGDCATQRAFYKVRRAICDTLGIPRSSVRPLTLLSGLPSPWGRLIGWYRIRRRAGFPKRLDPITDSAVLAVLVAVLVSIPIAFEGWTAYNGLVICLGLIAIIASLALPGRLLGWFPERRRTVGDAARLVAALEAPAPKPGKRAWTREEVSLAIDRLFMDATGVRDFTDDSFPLD